LRHKCTIRRKLKSSIALTTCKFSAIHDDFPKRSNTDKPCPV
jgi:hypothetical protein